MKNYVRYNGKGEILKSGQCSTAKFKRLKQAGVLILEGVGNDEEYEIKNGKIVSKGNKKKTRLLAFPVASISEEQWQDVLNRITALEEVQ